MISVFFFKKYVFDASKMPFPKEEFDSLNPEMRDGLLNSFGPAPNATYHPCLYLAFLFAM